jgi:hypothetical protein
VGHPLHGGRKDEAYVELILDGVVIGMSKGLVGIVGEAFLGVGELLSKGLERLLLLRVRGLVGKQRRQQSLLLQVVHRVYARD